MTALHLVATLTFAVTTALASPREIARPLIPVPPPPSAPGMVFLGGAYLPGPYVFEKRQEGDAILVTLGRHVIDRLPRSTSGPAGKSAAEMERVRERTIEAYEQVLANGGALVLLTRVQVAMPTARVRDTLIPTLRAIADRSLQPESRRSALIEIWKDESIVDELTSTYRHDASLWDRLHLIEGGR